MGSAEDDLQGELKGVKRQWWHGKGAVYRRQNAAAAAARDGLIQHLAKAKRSSSSNNWVRWQAGFAWVVSNGVAGQGNAKGKERRRKKEEKGKGKGGVSWGSNGCLLIKTLTPLLILFRGRLARTRESKWNEEIKWRRKEWILLI